jgi:MFS transporter, MHS family, shikimate and dehydroshikimate transport protein
MSVIERLGGEDTGRETSVGKVAVASTIGATIEWYDFFLYGTAAGLIFNQLFFPPGNPTAGTLAAYATFAAGFVARPVGGFIFGHFGDRIGRKTMLVLTLLIMGVATFAIGLVPTYAQIGIWAPVILLTLRVLQGIGLGGEWGGAVLMAVEHAPEGRRGFFGSWPQLGVGAGLLLGTAAFSVLSIVMPEEAFLSWGWRVAFLASGVLVAVGMYIRLQIMESPAFTEIKESSSEVKVPFAELLRTQPKEAFLSLGSRLAEGVSFNVYGVFVISYITATLKLPMTTALLGVSVAAAIMCVLTPVYGALSDRVGRRPVFAVGAVLFGLFAIPSFLLFNTRETVWIVLALVLAFGIIHPAMEGILSSFWSELFDTRVRYTGVSFAYQFSGIFASGLTPLVATWLLAAGGGRPWFLGAYMMGAALVTVISVFALPETYQKDIDPVMAPAPEPEPEPAVKS